MFIWFGINVDQNIETFKNNFLRVAQKHNTVPQFNFHPAHISLKISSEINDDIFEDAVNDCLEYYKTLAPFDIFKNCIEIENTFLWLRWKENSNLNKIHSDLCVLMKDKYQIELHPFDYNYKFHTTLFVDADKLSNELINDVFALEIPSKIKANNFFVGFSKDNISENYKIYKSVKLGE